MSTSNESDGQFHENLEAMGRSVSAPEGVSHDVRSQCLAELRTSTMRHTARFRRNRRLFPALGIAASVVLAAGLFIPWQSARTVQAAEILAALDAQLEGSSVLELNIESLAVDEVTLSGHLQVAHNAVAGDVMVEVLENPKEGPIRIDASLGLSDGNGWVLLRELQIPDVDAQAVISLFMPPGTETLLVIPEAALAGKIGTEIEEPLKAMSSDGVKQVIEALLASASDVGASVSHQADGTVLLTIPLDNQEAMGVLIRTVVESMKDMEGIDAGDMPSEKELDEMETSIQEDSDLQMLVGSTIRVVYDPDAGAVRSFSLDGIGDANGSISIAIHGGEIDPALLDSSRVTGLNTRRLDLGAIKSLIGSIDLDSGQLRIGAGATGSTEDDSQ